MAKKGIFLKEEVGFKAEMPKPRKTVSVKAKVKSVKQADKKIK